VAGGDVDVARRRFDVNAGGGGRGGGHRAPSPPCLKANEPVTMLGKVDVT
jgi:hypothetical protein